MITRRLYDEDSFIAFFEAKVLSCDICNGGYKILLDKTCFFPEAGGQPCDKGTLNGIEVFNVLIENDELFHYCRENFEVGSTVNGSIDFERRFCFMQNHSGEHIVSGIVNRLFGFDNVGFHLNEELVTLDFNGMLSKEQIKEVEYLANKSVWQNNAVKAYHPSDDELKNTEYRQKKELSGAIRLVEIGNTDICACCAPHVKCTGQIGMIKLLSTEKMRGGIRIIMKCGGYALADYNEKLSNVSEIGNLLSAKHNETAAAVEKLLLKQNELKQEITETKKKLIECIAEGIRENLFFADDFSMTELQMLADLLYKKTGEIHSVFSGKGSTYNFVICGNEEKTNELFSKVKNAVDIKGGGRNGMISGKINAEKEDIIKEFAV